MDKYRVKSEQNHFTWNQTESFVLVQSDNVIETDERKVKKERSCK